MIAAINLMMAFVTVGILSYLDDWDTYQFFIAYCLFAILLAVQNISNK